ncbi:MAG: asparagine synthase (glutamine-hydrolyzing) [Proteobacteria bacterium]|nr:asparagine synthase (glutamine-hydrolyzing) [Pseudomonadota bacterium]
MCGIAGVISQSEFRPDKAYMARLTDAVAHRGPDGVGTWFGAGRKVAFGHRRLAIIDLSAPANQPMVSADGQVALIFNGEIYNHVQLRKQLEDAGVRGWQTSHSDTEVVLMAYRHWGMPACLQHLRGMFAFAIWDNAVGKLFLARDRVGEKPLYYSHQNGRLIFGSEIKVILADASVERAVDEESLFHYLTFLMVPPPKTLFKGIHKLPAAHWLEVELEAESVPVVREYWDPLDAAADYAAKVRLPKDEKGWVAHLGRLVRESVRLRQEAADVPVGVFLSGGVDSSAVATLATDWVGKGKLRTFAIGPDKEYPNWIDETPFAAQVAEKIGSKHEVVRLREADFMAILPKFINWQDEPVADPAALPIYFLSRAATDAGLKVCQGGEGGDELFIGYEDWMKFEKLERWNRWPLPRFIKKLGYGALLLLGRGGRFWVEYLRRGAAGEPIFWGGAEAFTSADKRQMLGPTMAAWRGRSSFEVVRPLWEKYQQKPAAQQSFWNWCTWLELHLRLPEQLLMRADKMSMATALELRVPLLDHVLIEAVLNSPPALRTKNGEKKHLLKRLLRGVVEKEILFRAKRGLGMPLDAWILGVYGAYARTVLADFCARTGYLRFEFVEQLFTEGRGQQVWYLLNLALWWKHFIVQERLDRIE